MADNPERQRILFVCLGNICRSPMAQGAFVNGCFLCNSAIEFGDDGGPILKQIRENFGRMLAAFEGALRRARDRGEVRSDLDPAASASALVGAFAGAALLLRGRIATDQVLAGMNIALNQMD